MVDAKAGTPTRTDHLEQFESAFEYDSIPTPIRDHESENDQENRAHYRLVDFVMSRGRDGNQSGKGEEGGGCKSDFYSFRQTPGKRRDNDWEKEKEEKYTVNAPRQYNQERIKNRINPVNGTAGPQPAELLHVVNEHKARAVQAVRNEHHVRYFRRKARHKRIDEKHEQAGKGNDESHPDLDEKLIRRFTFLVDEFRMFEHAERLFGTYCGLFGELFRAYPICEFTGMTCPVSRSPSVQLPFLLAMLLVRSQ
jgi:hypothetical protein